jgi:curved DNA-binding protein CbpA
MSEIRQNPFIVLGVDPGADEQQIKTAYLQLIKVHRPESDPEKFKEIRSAYDELKDPTAQARALLRFGFKPGSPQAVDTKPQRHQAPTREGLVKLDPFGPFNRVPKARSIECLEKEIK